MRPRITRRDALRQTGCFTLFSFSVVSTAHAATSIVAVRVWPAEEYTRITLESDSALSTTHRLHKNPDRLSIDIEGLEMSEPLRELIGKVRPDDPYIAGVRIAQFSPRVLRLVLDLKQTAVPQVFTLKPVAAYQHRLVFDLHPAVEVDPLLALVREKESAERRAAAQVRDALGELIDRVEGRSSSTTTPSATTTTTQRRPRLRCLARAPPNPRPAQAPKTNARLTA